MIICGFPGTGKSCMARLNRTGRWVDLESTPFERDWGRYAKVAKHMSESGYAVMVSTHKELLDKLEQMEVSYTVIVPSITDKETYMDRYERRGDSYDFIHMLDENWNKWITAIVDKPSVLKTVVILPKDGCIRAFVEAFHVWGMP